MGRGVTEKDKRRPSNPAQREMCWNHSHGEPAWQAWLGQERGGGLGLRSWLGLVLVWCPGSLGQPPALSLCPPKCTPGVIMLAPHPTVRRTKSNRVHEIQAQRLALGRTPQTSMVTGGRTEAGRTSEKPFPPGSRRKEG